MLEQVFRRSFAQNRGLGGDVTLKSGEPAAVPTAAAAIGVQKTTEKSAAEPRYMTFEAQNFYLHDYALLRLEHVAIGPRALSYHELLMPKLYFEAKTPVFTPLQYR